MKKNFKKTLLTRIITFTLALAMVLSSCLIYGNTADAKKKKVKVTKVKINTGKVLVLKKGQKKKLSVTVSPKKASNKKVTYKSSKKKVVKVSKKGVVKAVAKKGSAKITVRSKSNKKKKATIKVKIGKPIKSIKVTGTKTRQEFYYANVTNIDKTSANYGKVSTVQKSRWVNKGIVFSKKKSASIKMELGMDKISLKTIYSPKKPTYKKVTYSSSNSSVASVVAKTIVPKKVGTTTITVKAADGSGKKAKIKVTVTKMGNYTTPAPTPKNVSLSDLEMIENFEGQKAGTNWSKWTAAGRTISKDGDVMQVVTDPEKSSNKCLKVTPQGYDLAPVLSFDLPAGKTLNDYSGVYVKVRVVAGPTADFTYKKIMAYFAPKGTLDYHYAFGTNEDTYKEQIAKDPVNGEKYYQFWADRSMALGNSDMYDSKGGSLDNMPTVTSKNETEGFKYYEDEPAVGFSARSLEFTKFLTDDLKKLSSFDLAVGASYKKPTDLTDGKLTWYIDDIALIKKPETQVKVTAIAVTGNDNVTVGTTAEYNATVTPANATEKGVIWSVSDPTKATIDAATGILTANAEGTVDVIATAKDGSKVSGKKTVNLKNAAVVSDDYTVDISKAADTTITDVGGIAALEKKDDYYESPKVKNNLKYFIDLGEPMDLSGYKQMEVVYSSPYGLAFELWGRDFDPSASEWYKNNKWEYYSASDDGTTTQHDEGSEYYTYTMPLSGDLSSIRYVSIGTNKFVGDTETFKVKSVKFIAPKAGEKDQLDELADISYPINEDFSNAESAKLGWSNWDDAAHNYKALKDATGLEFKTDDGNYIKAPGHQYDGIALPFDNRKGEAAKDFYVEATVKAPSATMIQVGISGGNTLEGKSSYYPGNTMKEYGNDYYLKRNVVNEWQVIKAKITVPAKKFGEARLKGNTADDSFLVKNVKIEEYTSQDLTMTDEPGVSKIPAEPTALDFTAGRPMNPGNNSDTEWTDDGITFSAEKIEAKDESKTEQILIPLGFKVEPEERIKVHVEGSVSRGVTSNSLRVWLSDENGNYGNYSNIGVVCDGDNESISADVVLEANKAASLLIFKGPSGSKFIKTTITKVEVSQAPANVIPTEPTALDFTAGRGLDPGNNSNRAWTDEGITFTAEKIEAKDESKTEQIMVPLGFTVKKGEKIKLHVEGSVSRGASSNSLRTWLSDDSAYGNNSEPPAVVSDGDNPSISTDVTLTATKDANVLMFKGPGGSKFIKTTITKLEVSAAE